MSPSRRFRTFEDAFAWLAARTNYETMATQRYDERTYGIVRAERLLASAGHPDLAFDVAQVVGSKGKGSTASALASVLTASGRRTGLFTSPHLVDPRERIRVDGVPIEDRFVVDALESLRGHVESAAERGEPATFFEIHTIAALIAFRAAGCAAVVLEAGMGGRLDATTAAAAKVKVLTSVSLDHTQHLGRSRAAIAREKAAVARPGVPFVSGEPRTSPAAAIVQSACHAAGAPLVAIGCDFRVAGAKSSFDTRTGHAKTSFVLHHAGSRLPLAVPLLGLHQARNAALAAIAARAAAWTGGPVTEDAIRRGLAATTIRARMEPISLDPLVIVDGAHTPASFAVLARTLTDALPGRRFVFVVGMSADKDVSGSLRRLRGLPGTVIATSSGQPRAAAPKVVADAARAAGIEARTAPDADAALRAARRLARKAGRRTGVVVVTGSLYLCGEVLALSV
ncbi:MAG: bifunctional folylpolyglutamate synthase/dihydrofolate synthase [Planctomycetes bacterium]|nr:bifunctional folylpolyglutamate synthase/dihydrofolate synthase [Planctomycetota bacterium]